MFHNVDGNMFLSYPEDVKVVVNSLKKIIYKIKFISIIMLSVYA